MQVYVQAMIHYKANQSKEKIISVGKVIVSFCAERCTAHAHQVVTISCQFNISLWFNVLEFQICSPKNNVVDSLIVEGASY